jgi:hypothetical protein
MKDHYAILGIARDAPAEVVRAAYRVLVQKYHPDRNSEPDAGRRAEEINAAYAVLKDPEQRALYDQQLPPLSGGAADDPDTDTSVRRPSDGGFEASPGPMRRTVGRTTYEIQFDDGVVHEHLEWTDTVQKVKHDHRLFVGIGKYIGTESTPRQRLWLRLGGAERLIERKGDLLPVATGQPVTLVTIHRPGVSKAPVPLALINRASDQWFPLENLAAVANGLLNTREAVLQTARFLAVFGAAITLLYFNFLRHGGFLAWCACLLVVLPLLFALIAKATQKESRRLEKDIRTGMAIAGMS